MIRKCIICGKDFDSAVSTAKYCDDICREKGQNIRRREWEQKTGYLEKKRLKQREKYQKERDLELLEREEIKKKAAAEKEKKDAKAHDDYMRELKAAAAAGDPFARMEIACMTSGNTSEEYWNAYKEYDLQFAESAGKTSRTNVNGFTVDLDNFGLLVSENIAEYGKIIIHVEHV